MSGGRSRPRNATPDDILWEYNEWSHDRLDVRDDNLTVVQAEFRSRSRCLTLQRRWCGRVCVRGRMRHSS